MNCLSLCMNKIFLNMLKVLFEGCRGKDFFFPLSKQLLEKYFYNIPSCSDINYVMAVDETYWKHY